MQSDLLLSQAASAGVHLDNLPVSSISMACATRHARREAGKFFLGIADARPPIELFFPPNPRALRNPKLFKTAVAIEKCERFRISGFTRETLCEWLAASGASPRVNCLQTLTTNFHKLYGASPGRFLRIWRILDKTDLMLREERYDARVSKEFRRTFQQAFGESFARFIQTAHRKHWIFKLMELQSNEEDVFTKK